MRQRSAGAPVHAAPGVRRRPTRDCAAISSYGLSGGDGGSTSGSWTGNDLQLIEHSPASWRKLVRARNPLVEPIRLDGIALAGSTSE